MKSNFLKSSASAALMLGALGWAFPAAAQTAPADKPPTSAAPAAQDGIQDIVVTAQRRSESSQRASLALTVLSGDALTKTGITQPESLSNLVPGVNVSFEGAHAQVYIRGVGTFAANSLAEGSVAFNIDQVYLSRPSGVGGMLFDVDRVEVLKGPQGTLYGRNATAGAVNVVTRRPTFDGIHAEGGVLYGNYNALVVDGAVNLPVSDEAGFRAAFQIAKHDGYLSDGTNDQDQQSARLKFRAAPRNAFTLDISVDYAHIGGKGPGAANYPPIDSSDPWIGLSDPRTNATIVAGTSLALQARGTPKATADAVALGAALVNDEFINYHIWGVSANFSTDLGFATLTVLPAFRQIDGGYKSNTGGFSFEDQEHSGTSTLEVRLSHDSPVLKWVMGGYLFNDNLKYNSRIFARPFINGQANTVPVLNDRTRALFGQATFSVTDRMRLIGGIRYTDEFKNIYGSRTDVALNPYSGVVGYKKVNWKAGVEFDAGPRSLLYATASTGFKAGGFNTVGSSVIIFRPEELRSYEVGSKNRFFNNTLQFNVSGFYWDYRDHQEPHLGPGPGGAVSFLTSNAGRATLYGVDVDLIVKPTRNDTITLSAEYNHSKYNTFSYDVNAGFATSATTGCAIGATHAVVIDGANVNVNTVDCSGFQLAKAPEFSINGSIEHVFELGNDSRLIAGISSRYSSSIWGGVDFIRNQRLPSYTQTNADLTYTLPGGRFSITGFVKNLENKAAYTNAFQAQFIAGLVHASILAPRTYGARASFRF